MGTGAAWIPETGQYYAEYEINGFGCGDIQSGKEAISSAEQKGTKDDDKSAHATCTGDFLTEIEGWGDETSYPGKT